MKKIIIALLIGCTAMVSGQNTISGLVTDSNNQAIIGVSIYAPELHKGTSTDEKGKYSLDNLPSGKIKLTFTYVGFAPQNKIV